MTVSMLKSNPSAEDKKRILTKALIKLVNQLDLSRQELSHIIGRSEPSISRMFTKSNFFLDPNSNEGQLALLLLRLFRNLDTLFGGNAKQCQMWLRNNNAHLNGVPIELIQSIEGLVFTVRYLDAMRGKN